MVTGHQREVVERRRGGAMNSYQYGRDSRNGLFSRVPATYDIVKTHHISNLSLSLSNSDFNSLHNYSLSDVRFRPGCASIQGQCQGLCQDHNYNDWAEAGCIQVEMMSGADEDRGGGVAAPMTRPRVERNVSKASQKDLGSYINKALAPFTSPRWGAIPR